MYKELTDAKLIKVHSELVANLKLPYSFMEKEGIIFQTYFKHLPSRRVEEIFYSYHNKNGVNPTCVMLTKLQFELINVKSEMADRYLKILLRR